MFHRNWWIAMWWTRASSVCSSMEENFMSVTLLVPFRSSLFLFLTKPRTPENKLTTIDQWLNLRQHRFNLRNFLLKWLNLNTNGLELIKVSCNTKAKYLDIIFLCILSSCLPQWWRWICFPLDLRHHRCYSGPLDVALLTYGCHWSWW